QGEPHPPSEGWTPTGRVVALAGASALASFGIARRGVAGATAIAAGTALAARAISNRAIYASSKPIEIQKTIAIDAPIDVVIELWNHLDRFPQFMAHVRHVELGPSGRTRWEVDGPFGTRIAFDAEISRPRPDILLWHTLPGQRVDHRGSVRFEAD